MAARTKRRTEVRARSRPKSLRLVADGLDVMTIWIEHKGAVVVWVVLRSQTRRAVVLAACCDGRLVEGIDCRARGHAECDVDGWLDRNALADPEIGTVRMAEAGAGRATAVRGRQLYQSRMASRRECLQIERLAPLVVTDDNAQVINHFSTFDLVKLWTTGVKSSAARFARAGAAQRTTR